MNKGFARTLRIGAIIVLPLCTTRSVLVAQAASTVLPAGSRTCGSVAACIFATNTAAGPGIEGVSAAGFGVKGISTSGRALSGVSLANDGVAGSTAENATTASPGKAGVAGYDKSTNKNTFNSGVYSASDYADGVQGRSAQPAVEDMGEASLVSGSAFVPIDGALSKSIDAASGYLVFLTPQGATSGLYVSGKSKLGFWVREIGNYHDSLVFDYRIVARPYGESGERLAAVNASFVPGVRARSLFYRHLQRLRFISGKLDPATLPKPSM
jgi:hypothetical protein